MTKSAPKPPIGPQPTYVSKVHSLAEDLFVEIFCDTFGPEKTQYLFTQYPMVDIYGNHRFIDFAFTSNEMKIAIEIDGERYHNPKMISRSKYTDDLLKQNSLVYQNWKVYRWVYTQLSRHKNRVRDELITFLGAYPEFSELKLNMPRQKGRIIEYKKHQLSALENLRLMRMEGETIALLYHATGTGKTVTAVSDAKNIGGRTLFLAHTKELIRQAYETFRTIWPQVSAGYFTGDVRDTAYQVICGSVQSVAQNLETFHPEDFAYIIVDECHHGAAATYKRILSYFKPKFTLGLTATPERADGEDVLEMFKNVAHKMDIRTAVETGELAAIRCIRVKTNVDISKVRINGIRYNTQDLESTLFVPDRNRTLLETWQNYVRGRKTVIFCASVEHAKQVAALFKVNDIPAEAVSGAMKQAHRINVLNEYERGAVKVLCACDLLNEGWDSPDTEVLFMARPTMSRTIYTQQLGRGMRRAPGKDEVLVFDFIDTSTLFNAPFSLHRILNISEYRPGHLTLAPPVMMVAENAMFYQGEKPEALLDMPLNVMDLELVNLFNWQEEVKGMISQLEVVRMVDVQTETVQRYLREGKIAADLEVPIGSDRKFRYFRTETVQKYAARYGWELITETNIKAKFMEMVQTMDMSYSYKPVLLKAMLAQCDASGKVRLAAVVDYFRAFYESRRLLGLPVEQRNSLYCRDEYTSKEAERNILINPFKRFEDMRFMQRSRDVEYIEINNTIWVQLTSDEKNRIIEHCDAKLEEYYLRIAETGETE